MDKAKEEKKREIEEYIKGLPEGWESNFGELFKVADKYYTAAYYRETLKYTDKMISLKPKSVAVYNFKASILNVLGEHNEAIDLFLKALELDKNSSLAFSSLLRTMIRTNKYEDLLPRIVNKPSIYDYYISDIVIFASSIITSDKIEYFKIFDGIKISDKCKDFQEYFWVKYIFETTKNADLRVYLISLYSTVLSIKQSLITKDIGNIQIGHYTKIENIKFLVSKNLTNFRLHNVAYMNDPSEGNILLELLSGTSENDVLGGYYNEPDQKGNRQVINHSNSYLGSFSKNIDSLSMWVQYGNDGKGCCLIFNKDCFDADEPFIPQTDFKALFMSSKAPKTKETKKYCLYDVVYTDSIDDLKNNKDTEDIYRLLKIIDALLILIEKEKKSIRSEKTLNRIRQLVINAIDQIRFLFKNTDYQHEREIRIVTSSPDEPIADEGEREKEIPHLYIEMEKNLKYDEIILGPKVDKPSEAAPYIYYTNKVKSVTKSAIKYQ